MNKKTKVLFISGMFAGGWIWERMLKYFPKDKYEIAVINKPLGEISNSINDLLNYVNENYISDYDEKIILVGNSLGSLIGLKLALNPNNNVIGCVLSGSPGMENTNLGIGKPKADEEWLEELSEKIFVNQEVVSDKARKSVFNFFTNRNNFRNIIRLTRETNNYRVTEDLKTIPYPTYLIWGSEDQITPIEPWVNVTENLDNCILYELDECGHSPMYEKPEEFCNYLLEACTQLEKEEINA